MLRREPGTWALGTTDGMNLRDRKDTSNIQRTAALFLLLHSLTSTWNTVGYQQRTVAWRDRRTTWAGKRIDGWMERPPTNKNMSDKNDFNALY